MCQDIRDVSFTDLVLADDENSPARILYLMVLFLFYTCIHDVYTAGFLIHVRIRKNMSNHVGARVLHVKKS